MIKVTASSLAWPRVFEAEEASLRRVLGPAALSVEHVGSTAVPGLAAKPWIDILVFVGSFEPAERYAEPLRGLGYEHVPAEHEAEKRRLAAGTDDVDAYTDAKIPVIVALEAQAGFVPGR
jgi:GrpB-like predicted nucleotidyltransferase (UPF0157 family)